jgi:hypothetical protein
MGNESESRDRFGDHGVNARPVRFGVPRPEAVFPATLVAGGEASVVVFVPPADVVGVLTVDVPAVVPATVVVVVGTVPPDVLVVVAVADVVADVAVVCAVPVVSVVPLVCVVAVVPVVSVPVVAVVAVVTTSPATSTCEMPLQLGPAPTRVTVTDVVPIPATV